MLYDIFAKIALAKIEEAIENGEFENLPGQGKPLNLDYLAGVPGDKRAAFTLLHNSGYLPEQVELLKEMADLRETLSACVDPEQTSVLTKKLRDLELRYNLSQELAGRKGPRRGNTRP
jgi:hypothetical protein